MLAPREYHDGERRKWDDFIAVSPHAEIMQSWEWGSVKVGLLAGQAGFPVWSVKRLGWEQGGELVAAAQILRRALPLGFSLLYIPRGPILSWEDTGLVRDVLGSLTAWVRRDAFANRSLFLRLEPPAPPSDKIAKVLASAGFRPYFKTVQPPRTLFINLERDPAQLLSSFRRTARNLIRRCQKEGIRVEALQGHTVNSFLDEFYGIYSETARRFSFPRRAFRQFELVREEFAPRGMLRLYRCVAADGTLLASGLATILGSRAWYIWGGSIREHPLAKFASYGYIWGMLTDLQKAGVKTFDFWGLGPEEDENHPWSGFTLFKTAFDGEPFDYAPAFDLPLSPLYPVFKFIDRLTTPRYRATSA